MTVFVRDARFKPGSYIRDDHIPPHLYCVLCEEPPSCLGEPDAAALRELQDRVQRDAHPLAHPSSLHAGEGCGL